VWIYRSQSGEPVVTVQLSYMSCINSY
jgi:hypothetical protein